MLLPLISFAAIASAIVVNKMVLQHLPLIFYVGLRTLISGCVLFLFARRRSHRFNVRYLRTDWVALVTVALMTTLVPALLKAYGIKYLLTSKAAFIGSLDPFVTALYAYLLLGERLNKSKLLGIAIAFSGALFLCFSTSPVEQTLPAFLIFSLPELAAFGAVALGRYGWIVAQQLLKRDRYTPMELNGVTMIISGACGLMLSSLVEGSLSIAPLMTPVIALRVLYSIVVGNVFGFTAYALVLKRHTANFASIAGFSTPIFITVFGWLLLGERVTLPVMVAGMIIFAGVYLFYREERA